MHRRGEGVGRTRRAGGVHHHTAMRNAEPDWEVILRKGPCSGNPLKGRLPWLLHTDRGRSVTWISGDYLFHLTSYIDIIVANNKGICTMA